MSAKSAPPTGTLQPVTVAVLLAAGEGSRFEDIRHKLRATPHVGGGTVFERSLRSVVAAEVGPVVVVTGALTAADFEHDPEAAQLLSCAEVTSHHNPDWADGQSTSVRTGVDAARDLGADAVVIGLADQPFITPYAWRAVATGLGPITVATYDGQRGNPVRLHADVWDLLPHDGDVGARALMQRHPELVTEVSCDGSSADIDTLEDLHRWQSN